MKGTEDGMNFRKMRELHNRKVGVAVNGSNFGCY
jgi:hypothetical protein